MPEMPSQGNPHPSGRAGIGAPPVEQQIRQVARDLMVEFEPELPPAIVHRVVIEAFEGLSSSRITTFVPILARRRARERLRQLAHS